MSIYYARGVCWLQLRGPLHDPKVSTTLVKRITQGASLVGQGRTLVAAIRYSNEDLGRSSMMFIYVLCITLVGTPCLDVGI
jgi:hypothetical protein